MDTFSTGSGAGAPGGRFDVGGAIGQTWEAFRANFLPFFIISVILLGLPPFIQALATPLHPVGVVAARGIGVVALLVGLASLILGAVQQAAVVRGTVLYENGRASTWRELLASTRPVIVPVIVVSLIYAVCVAIGCVLLLAPGLFIATAWGAAVPTAVVERLGVGGSLQRSWDLTRNHRWAVLGAFIILGLIAVGLTLVIGVVGGFAAALGGDNIVGQVLKGLVSAVLQGVVGAFSSTGLATVYTHLRRAKEGITPSALASVFD